MTAATRSDRSARLRRVFRLTRYACGGVAIRIGWHDAATDALLAALGTRQAALLTAWNPMSRPLPAAINIRRQRRLLARLRGRPVLSASGGLGRWSEEMLLVAAGPSRLAALARRFRQHAIVELRRGRPARLVWL